VVASDEGECFWVTQFLDPQIPSFFPLWIVFWHCGRIYHHIDIIRQVLTAMSVEIFPRRECLSWGEMHIRSRNMYASLCEQAEYSRDPDTTHTNEMRFFDV
jgi:hypothetical protein